MNKFVSGINNVQKWTTTENGADALKSTTNALLDLFATIGALRSRTEREVEDKFEKAFESDALASTKLSFYSRNIRGGLGERKVSRTIWRWLAFHKPEVMKKNIHLVPVFGRWDDLYTFVGTELEGSAWELISYQWNQDLSNMSEGKPISLLGKWLKSVNTSSPESVKLGKLTATILGYSEREYRIYLSAMRSYLHVVEKAMSSKDWDSINYAQVPSKAMTNYRKAFSKNDPTRFVAYLASVKKGEAKINAGTLYPYDIVEKIMRGENSDVLEAQWKALPNYVEGENNMLVMADTSDSMNGRPLATSVGLAIYFAERNKGPFANLFMTFSSKPEFVTLQGKTLLQKVTNAKSTHWEQNTDFELAFKEILRVAVANKVPQSDMPKALIVISDMEFDTATRSYGRYQKKSYFEIMTRAFNDNGYTLPVVIFWNVAARNDVFHAEMQDGVQFASGQSASVFKAIVSGANMGPYEMMMNTLNDPQYDVVTI